MEAAREAMVLLKNQNGTLPLKKESIKTLAVIGPTADSLSALVGNYNGDPSHPATFVQGLRDALGTKGRVLYTAGCPIVTEQIPLEEAVPAGCLFSDATMKMPGLVADYYGNPSFAGQAMRTRYEKEIDFNFATQNARDPINLAEGLSVRWRGVIVAPQTGDYQLGITARDGFRLTLDGKVIVDEWQTGNRRTTGQAVRLEAGKPAPILVEYFHPRTAAGGGGRGGFGGGGRGGAGGGEGGGGVAATQAAGNVPPRDSAEIHLEWTRPTADGGPAGADGLPLYADALRAAQGADAVVMVLGITAEQEREEHFINIQGFSGGDRTSLDLPLVQERMLEQVMAAAGNKPVILVLTSGSALSVNWANEHVPAIIEAWYPGQRGGNALAEILFGAFNPAGRLPVTFYKSVDDLPAFTDYHMSPGPENKGRTYRYFTGEPLYPFGYGLSYTTFEYSDVKLASQNAATGENITVTATVKNSGSVAGDEVVQVYLERQAGGAGGEAPMPQKTLAGFLRVSLKPGESKTIDFTITPHQLALVNEQGKREERAGELAVVVGPNSASGKRVALTLRGETMTPSYSFVAPKLRELAAP
jgi:beta-glucosidase